MGKRQFIIAWGAGYEHGHRLADEKLFTEDNGFDEEDIKAIMALKVAEAYRCNDIWTATVLRIEDEQ